MLGETSIEGIEADKDRADSDRVVIHNRGAKEVLGRKKGMLSKETTNKAEKY